MYSNPYQRIERIMEYYNLNPNSLAVSIGLKRAQNLYDIRDGKVQSISNNLAEKIITVFPVINKNWLLTGNGNMTYNEDTKLNNKLIKLYDVEASGGFGSFESMIDENKVVGEFVIPTFSSAEWMIYVKGSSMYPKYSSGDIIACKQLNESKFLQWNKVYVLATKEQGLLVKRLMPSEKEKHIQAVSDNKDYPPFDVPEDEIIGIAIVLGVIRLE